MLGLCQYQLNLNDSAMANIEAAKDLGIRKEEQLENVLRISRRHAVAAQG